MCRMSKHEPTQDHACKRCGAAFELNRNRYQIFCSYNCRNLWYLDVGKPPRISKKCAVCGREFQSTKNSPKISCSPACARERTYRIQRVNPSQRKGAEVECRSCGKRFVKYHQNALYCSPECQKTRGKINYAPRECVVCKGSFMPKRSDSMESSQPLWNGWEITPHQPTLSDAEEPSTNALATSLNWTLASDLVSNTEPSLLCYDLDETFLPTLEAETRLIPSTPLGMTCCCDSPNRDWQNCALLWYHEHEIPLSHLFVKSIMDPQDQASPKPSFNLFRQLILSYLESGGTITMDSPRSSWMTLMDLSFRLAILNDTSIDTLVTFRRKVEQSPSLPIPLSSRRTYTRLIGGLKKSLVKMAEELYGAAYLAWWSTNYLSMDN